MRGHMEQLFRNRPIRVVLFLILLSALTGCTGKGQTLNIESGVITDTAVGSDRISGGYADVMMRGKGVLRAIGDGGHICQIEDLKAGEIQSFLVSENAGKTLGSIPVGSQVAYRYFLPQIQGDLPSLVSLSIDDA